MAEQKNGARRLVALVVTYNRLAQLKITVQRLLETPEAALQAVVVIDNASQDGTADWLATLDDPRLMVIRSEENLGGAGGFETGMRQAVERFDADWLVVMDDDARPDPGALEAFHQLDLSQWDAVAAAVYFPNGEICEMNRPSRNPFWHAREFWRTLRTGRGGFHLRAEAYSAAQGRPIDVTSFVGFFISRHGIELAGYPDPALFLYGDDGLYTLGLSQAGGRIGFEPSVRFEHDCSTFDNAQRGRFKPLWKVYYYHRNLLLLYRMASGWLFWGVMLLVVPKWLLKVRQHKGERWQFLKLMLRALRDGILQRSGVPHAKVLDWDRSPPR